MHNVGIQIFECTFNTSRTLFAFCTILWMCVLNLKSRLKVIPRSFSLSIVQIWCNSALEPIVLLPSWRIQTKKQMLTFSKIEIHLPFNEETKIRLQNITVVRGNDSSIYLGVIKSFIFVLLECQQMLASTYCSLIWKSLIFVRVMLFKISENRNPLKITRYTV